MRISVTERCNFRCVYCMPADGLAPIPREHLLSFEEIARVVKVASRLGLSKVRLTGGEPTVRRDLPKLVAMIYAVPGIREIAMTTNGSRLSELAEPLKRAGLRRINISLDTLRPDRNQELTRRDLLIDVLNGVDEAIRAGFLPIKFNAVVLRGINDDELCDLAAFAHERGSQMRFIEYMPMGGARLDERNRSVRMPEMLKRLRQRYDLVPEQNDLSDPARGWICRSTGTRIGFITSMSEHFCDTCNRMRLTAEGSLRPCLHQDVEVDLKKILRGGGSDEDIENAFRQAAGSKWAGHQMNSFVPIYSSKEMLSIGG